MKIKIEKSHFAMAQAPQVRERLNEMKECFTAEDIERAAALYAEENHVLGIYDVKASISGHKGGGLCESSDGYDATIDCWVEMLVETSNACYRVGFYVLDFWQLAWGIDYDNRDEVRSRAYIRKFICND